MCSTRRWGVELTKWNVLHMHHIWRCVPSMVSVKQNPADDKQDGGRGERKLPYSDRWLMGEDVMGEDVMGNDANCWPHMPSIIDGKQCQLLASSCHQLLLMANSANCWPHMPSIIDGKQCQLLAGSCHQLLLMANSANCWPAHAINYYWWQIVPTVGCTCHQ